MAAAKSVMRVISASNQARRTWGYQLLCKRIRKHRRPFDSAEGRRIVLIRWERYRARQREQAVLERQRLGV